MNESEIQQKIQIEAATHGSILLRNNCGAFTDATGRHVRYGLGNTSKKRNDEIKSSDLIGITTITITPQMAGTRVGIFTAVECKSSDWNPNKALDRHELAQQTFTDWVKARGGFAGFAYSLESLGEILHR